KLLGLKPSEPELISEQKVRVVFFDVGGVHIELLEPTCPESTIAAFLKKKGPGLHHLAFMTSGVESELERLSCEGIRLIDQSPKTGAHGMKIAFAHPESTAGVLSELCEKPTKGHDR
ncbi:MAG: VOC family protein, partial [Desulfobacula sp.]|nr:VOC family protein [Desulfobacula sp.]